MLEVGLTGGIASGKSTVDTMFAARGAFIIDADALVHDLLERPGAERDAVLQHFGAAVQDPSGSIDRRRLAAIVFADAGARQQLNAILHPAVRREEARLKAEQRRAGGGIVITDVTLLVETGRHRDYHRVVVVFCDAALQLARLLARQTGMTVDEANQRLAAQTDAETRRAVADYLIDTSGSLAGTEDAVNRIYIHLFEDLETLRRGETLAPRAPGAS